MNVIVMCETSGVVREAFRKRGHNAWSCDVLPCDDASPYHFNCMGEELLRAPAGIPWPLNDRDGYTKGLTSTWVDLPQWDLMIAHPPCTYLCNSGVRWLWEWPDKSKGWNAVRAAEIVKAADLFNAFWQSGIPKIAIENPIPHRHGRLPPYSQIIQPWQFGHGETKATCLWLRGLPLLKPTNIVTGRAHRMHRMPPGPNRWKLRSKTYQGIADAMAEQWG